MYLIASSHHDHQPPWTTQRLIEYLDLPAHPVVSLLSLLREEGFLSETTDDPPAYLPARSSATVELRALLEAVRTAEEKRFPPLGSASPALAAANAVVADAWESVRTKLGGTTLRDLILATRREEESGPRPGGPAV
jgi:hypothetical protein